ncbi:hypothetical protein C2S44_07680 [Helicobacter pylori]|nr:hypothetical protein C2S44_07680 [Helicobacter pylori]
MVGVTKKASLILAVIFGFAVFFLEIIVIALWEFIFHAKQAVVNLIEKAPTFPHPLALYEKIE